MASSASPYLLQRMAEKKQELEQLSVLRQLASHLQTHFDELSEKLDGLMQGNQGSYFHSREHEHNNDSIEISELTSSLVSCFKGA